MQIVPKYRRIKLFSYLLTVTVLFGCQPAKKEIDINGKISNYELKFKVNNNSKKTIFVSGSLVNNRIEDSVYWIEGIYRNMKGRTMMAEFSFTPKEMIEILPGEYFQKELKGKFDKNAKYFLRIYSTSFKTYLKKVNGEISTSSFREFQKKHSKLILITTKK